MRARRISFVILGVTTIALVIAWSMRDPKPCVSMRLVTTEAPPSYIRAAVGPAYVCGEVAMTNNSRYGIHLVRCFLLHETPHGWEDSGEIPFCSSGPFNFGMSPHGAMRSALTFTSIVDTGRRCKIGWTYEVYTRIASPRWLPEWLKSRLPETRSETAMTDPVDLRPDASAQIR
jgi:hypothetical protein